MPSSRTANQTGKSGNSSGSRVREARGDSHGTKGRGKHPPNKLYTSPKTAVGAGKTRDRPGR
jgi:hypothetical protein